MAYTTINKSSDHFKALYYSGTGAENAITADHASNFVWLKQANGTDHHTLYDSTRGATNYILSNLANAEATNAQSLKSFDNNGFTLGTDGAVNSSSYTYIGQSWKANGQGSANSDGSTTTTYTSANTTSGFSIIKYGGTGSTATIGHGLGATPKVLWLKQLDGTENWRVWHVKAPNYSTKTLSLNQDLAEFNQSNWVGTVNNSTIELGSDGSVNLNAKNYICYAFAEKTGFSKFSIYDGNGEAGNGTFIYTGFKPAFIMIKRTDSTGNWNMYNMTLNKTNKSQFFHHDANTNTQWYDNQDELEVFSNGFRPIGSTKTDTNVNNGKYIYMAWAEAPLVGSNNVPCVAR